jgi:hypothetical protein
MSEIKMNTNIPGWNGKEILYQIGTYASQVPENGVIIELGALFGRSTYTIGHSKHPSVRLFTIDLFTKILFKDHEQVGFHDDRTSGLEKAIMQSMIRDNPKRIGGDNVFRLWEIYNHDIPNLFGQRGNTSTIDTTTFPYADMIFHDAGHEYNDIYTDLSRWWPRVKQDGILIIDDYEPAFAGLVKGVDQFVLENDLEIEFLTHRNVLLRRKK